MLNLYLVNLGINLKIEAMNTAQENRIITWKTSKQADGTYTGTCYTFTSIKQAVDGRYTTPWVVLYVGKAKTRARAQSMAIKACRYYKNTANASALEAKLVSACPAHGVTDATPSL